MSALIDDLRFASRMLLKKPSYSVIAIITLALAIGANSAIFSVVKSVLLQSLPFPNADRLVQFHLYYPSFNDEQSWISARDGAEWESLTGSFESIGVYRYAMLNFNTDGLPEAIYGV